MALDLLEAPDSVRLMEFLSRTPNMFNVIILSPHGFFGQKDVLGKPDTGGQVSCLGLIMIVMLSANNIVCGQTTCIELETISDVTCGSFTL